MYIRSLEKFYVSNDNMLPGSDNPHEFELLVRDCAAIELGQDFHLYGRSGQVQHGIDIFSEDWTILIQCKAYRETKENYKRFQADIEAEFIKAKNHFQREGKLFFQRFILATTLKGDTSAQDIAREATVQEIAQKLSEQESNMKITIWFWGDLLKIIHNYSIYNDGDSYAKGFEETLFLHKNWPGCENVNLKNLFVPQEYCEMRLGNGFGDPMDDLEERILRFCRDDKDKMLIIEGDAGSGKSTLAAMLCFEEKKHSHQIIETAPDGSSPLAISPSLLAGRPLLTIRLRDLEITGNPEFKLGQSILSHLKILNKKELDKQFYRAVFLLDGFDELCMMIEDVCDRENMLSQLCSWLLGDYKLILTSRPKYIHVERLSDAFSFSMISLQHFNPRKREEWLNRYRKLITKDSGAVDEKVAQYILSMDEDSVSNLCDTPMTLYLLIGSKANFELTKNEWALYRHIFTVAVVNTPYAGQLGGSSHPMGSNKSRMLYWITEEIAYKMYCADESPEDQSTIQTEDGQFLVTGKTVTRIIEKLLKDRQFYESAVQAGLKDVNSFDLQRIHALCCYWRSGSTDGPVEFYHNNIRDFFLCEKIRRELNWLYQESGSDEAKTDRMALRLVNLFKYGKINETVCRFLRAYARDAVSTQQRTEFPLREKEHPLLPTLYQKLLTNGILYDGLGVNNHGEAIMNILRNTAIVYRNVYEPILEKEEKIHWWNDVMAVNRSGMMRYFFICFVGEIGSRSDLHFANLYRAVMCNADLHSADLTFANLQFADLSWANLREANLREADLQRADLSYADLHGADLRGATSPIGGFLSDSQDEQIAEWKSLEIPGLKF